MTTALVLAIAAGVGVLVYGLTREDPPGDPAVPYALRMLGRGNNPPARRPAPRLEGDRIYRLYLGQQKSGKTYQLREEVTYFRSRGCTVFVCDTKREFGDLGVVYPSFEAFDRLAGDELPPVCVFQLKRPEDYAAVFAEAIAQCEPNADRTICVVVDEFWAFAPAGSTWRGCDELREILLAGRHLENADGDVGQVHLVGAMQYPHTAHLIVWQQADSILVGAARGDRFFSWLRGNHQAGNELEAKARSLEPRQWLLVEGEPRPGMTLEKP